jgi:asparagine synthetase B (glutamine-hydrolysing)
VFTFSNSPLVLRIVALIGAVARDETQQSELRAHVVSMSSVLRHRGPDWSGTVVQRINNHINILAHERLAIVDPVGGAQPLTNEDSSVALTVNGEIFNHMELRKGLVKQPKFKTGSDCEVILHLADEVDAAQLCSGNECKQLEQFAKIHQIKHFSLQHWTVTLPL